MGLDMYALSTTENIPDVDFECPENRAEVFYWRKRPNLHGWMETLYRSKGAEVEFNCVAVRLDQADLDVLEKAINQNSLPHTEGFFFGVSDGSEKADDLEFIRKAREEIHAGKAVYYSSWW